MLVKMVDDVDKRPSLGGEPAERPVEGNPDSTPNSSSASNVWLRRASKSVRTTTSSIWGLFRPDTCSEGAKGYELEPQSSSPAAVGEAILACPACHRLARPGQHIGGPEENTMPLVNMMSSRS